MKENRTKTGEWEGETISRPKTLGERHPEAFKAKTKALGKMGGTRNPKDSYSKQMYGHEKKKETYADYMKKVAENKTYHENKHKAEA